MVRNLQKLIIVLLFATGAVQAAAPTNLIRPYDFNLEPRFWPEQRFYWTQHLLMGTGGGHAWNGAGHMVPDTQLWNPNQDALAMVNGYPQGTNLSNIAQLTNAIDGDNGVRGNFQVNGDFKIELSYLIGLTYRPAREWWIAAYLPVYKMALKNVQWIDQTQYITADDIATHTYITDNLFANVAQWGDGLSLQSWERAGCGDLTLMGGWGRSYPQRKPWIKRVDAEARVGIVIPVGVCKDEDKIMSMPFGNDGAAGLIIAGGLNINFWRWLDAGFDIELMHVFNNTRARRIKVDINQTEFLLLTKTAVQKDPGFNQRFTLYIEPQFGAGVSFRAAYQHLRHSSDSLFVRSNQYSSAIANTAQYAQEWTTHQFIGQLKWDLADDNRQNYMPQFDIYCALPFHGMRVVQTPQVGFGVTLTF